MCGGNPFIYLTYVVLNYCKRSMTARGGIMLLMSEIYSALGIFSADWYFVFCWSLLLQSPEKRRNAQRGLFHARRSKYAVFFYPFLAYFPPASVWVVSCLPSSRIDGFLTVCVRSGSLCSLLWPPT